MMDEKDTVMNDEKIKNIFNKMYVNNKGVYGHKEVGKAIAEAQAQISFEAGKKEGRREVVEWIEKNVYWRTDAPYKSTLDPDKWQDQLKEWGLE